jgi:hypothetical protein
VPERFEELQQFMRACHRVVTLLLSSWARALVIRMGC